MKKLSHPLFSILFIYFILCVSISANAQNAPEREIKVLGDINPYEVVLYRSFNFEDVITSWRLAPGLRMLKIPQLDDVPLSIRLGSKVSVILFPNYDFNSYTQKASAYTTLTFGGHKEPTKKFLISYFRFKSSKPQIVYPKGSPYRASLIIHRRDIGDILGVHLKSGNYFGQFYPLPEKANDSAIIYHKVTQGGPRTLSIVPGGNGQMALYPPTSHPNQYDIRITITSDGTERKLPGPNNKSTLFDLNTLGVRQISSLKLEYKGPIDEQAYLDLPPKKHRAPPAASSPVVSAKDKEDPPHQFAMPPARTIEHGNSARGISNVGTGSMTASQKQALPPQKAPPAPIPNVSGSWKSNIGVVYDMTQNGNKFEWTVKTKNEAGKGVINGSDISASWKSPFGSGASNGRITAFDSAGKPTKIRWNNGVVFYR